MRGDGEEVLGRGGEGIGEGWWRGVLVKGIGKGWWKAGVKEIQTCLVMERRYWCGVVVRGTGEGWWRRQGWGSIPVFPSM